MMMRVFVHINLMPHFLLLFAICVCVFLVPVLAYILFSLRAKKLTIADAIYVSLILIGVAFFLFFAIALELNTDERNVFIYHKNFVDRLISGI